MKQSRELFISYGCAFNLNPQKLEELIENISGVFELFKSEINKIII